MQDFKNQAEQRRSNKQETSMYTAAEHVPNSFTKSIPVESYWSILFAGSLNATGFFRWAYDARVENPLGSTLIGRFRQEIASLFIRHTGKRNILKVNSLFVWLSLMKAFGM